MNHGEEGSGSIDGAEMPFRASHGEPENPQTGRENPRENQGVVGPASRGIDHGDCHDHEWTDRWRNELRRFNRAGIALASASLALTAYGIGATVGRVGFGALADRLGARAVMRICVVLEVVALTVLLFGPPQEVLFVVLAVFGMGFSGGDTAFVRIIPDVFGLEALGAITGLLALGWRIGAALGPAIAGFVYDATGSYAVPFSLAPVALILSLALFSWGSASRRSA